MAFTYAAGDSTPGLIGQIDVGSIRINQNGTYELHAFTGVFDGSSPTRDYVSDLPNDHGGYPGLALSGPRLAVIEGLLTVPVLADVDGAVDLLGSTFSLDNGPQVFTLNKPGWSATRQITAQVVGDGVRIIEPDGLDKKVPDRLFSVAVVAVDPRIYSTTEHSQTITTSTSVTNAGNRACPIKVRFNGPQTDPQIDLDGTFGSARIRYAGAIPGGGYIEVAAFAASSGGVYAIDDAGDNAMGTDSYAGPITAFTARTVPKGSSSWTSTNTTGSGTTVLYWRDAW